MREQILSLTAEGKTPTEIAAELGCHRTYVYRVLGKMSDSRKVLAMLEDIRREQREIKSMLRLMAGQDRHPVTRALRGLDFTASAAAVKK